MKVPAAQARAVAKELLDFIGPECVKFIVAGSLRRRRPEVSDVEILFIPKLIKVAGPEDLLGHAETVLLNKTDRMLGRLLESGLLKKRPKSDGTFTWGEKNKLGIHTPSGIGVDFFTAWDANWWNYLVCRTGGEETNRRIAMAARDKGWKWNPYGEGFTCLTGLAQKKVTSEEDVFGFVGIPYLEPWQR